jgi:hypothetical protein
VKYFQRSRIAALVLLSHALLACTNPCDTLELRVCEEEVDQKRCDLIQEPERRALLTGDTCEAILKTMDERR